MKWKLELWFTPPAVVELTRFEDLRHTRFHPNHLAVEALPSQPSLVSSRELSGFHNIAFKRLGRPIVRRLEEFCVLSFCNYTEAKQAVEVPSLIHTSTFTFLWDTTTHREGIQSWETHNGRSRGLFSLF